MNCSSLIDTLKKESDLHDEGLLFLLKSEDSLPPLSRAADEVRKGRYSDRVYIRGLIEFTSFCKNDCLYCGLRCSNKNAKRYRLGDDEILSACEKGHALGFRTFVLQGGEDLFFTDEKIASLCFKIKSRFPDSALTLSVGEREKESYALLKKSGADRYLLRHETADRAHYERLHPVSMSYDRRMRCLYDLKELSFQVGAGFMVGSPFQTLDDIISDLRFLRLLSPDMVGIGPFVHHSDTPFAGFPNGSVELTLKLISIIRLMLPHALIPATTALATLDARGREKGLKAGANVLMPNLSPQGAREKYAIYENKCTVGAEAAENIQRLTEEVLSYGYRLTMDKGDVKR